MTIIYNRFTLLVLSILLLIIPFNGLIVDILVTIINFYGVRLFNLINDRSYSFFDFFT